MTTSNMALLIQQLNVEDQLYCKTFLFGLCFLVGVLPRIRLLPLGGREHSIVIEKVRHRKTWLPRQNSICAHCINGVVDDEFLFLTEYNKYNNIRETYFSRTEDICSGFTKMREEKLSFLLCEAMHVGRITIIDLISPPIRSHKPKKSHIS